MDDFFDGEGFGELSNLLEKYEEAVDGVMDVLEFGAQMLAKDVRALPRPMSQIRKPGYTHLINTITTKKDENEIEIGWGKNYGPFVEKGTTKMGMTPHLRPTFERNYEKYYKAMEEKLFGKVR